MTAERSGGPGEDVVIVARDMVYRYRHHEPHPVLAGIDIQISVGDYLLIAGRSGSGKSTLCRTFNGLIPHFHGGVLGGDLNVAGLSVAQTPIAELFSRVGMALQNPDAQLFCRTVEKELLFGMESLGLECSEMDARLETTLTRAGIANLRRRDPQTLSGGEKHLVLIAAFLALRPAIVVLDEPFANLDPANVRRVRALLRSLHAAGTGIVLCEHRLSRAVHDANRMVVLDRGRVIADGSVRGVLAQVTDDWGLEPPLATRMASSMGLPAGNRSIGALGAYAPRLDLIRQLEPPPPVVHGEPDGPPVLSVEGLTGRQGRRTVLEDVGFDLHAGECMAIVGANGAGKTTLLRHLMGLQRPAAGRIRLHGRDTRKRPVAELAREIGLAFQNPDNQFFKSTVAEELRVGPDALGILDDAWVNELMTLFHLNRLCDQPPFRLSGGEKKRVAFACALASKPSILVLDEPTAGQDRFFRQSLQELLLRLQTKGRSIVVVTHDLTFAERVARRWLVMTAGRILADGDPDQVMADAELMARAGLEPTDRFRLMRMWAHA